MQIAPDSGLGAGIDFGLSLSSGVGREGSAFAAVNNTAMDLGGNILKSSVGKKWVCGR